MLTSCAAPHRTAAGTDHTPCGSDTPSRSGMKRCGHPGHARRTRSLAVVATTRRRTALRPGWSESGSEVVEAHTGISARGTGGRLAYPIRLSQLAVIEPAERVRRTHAGGVGSCSLHRRPQVRVALSQRLDESAKGVPARVRVALAKPACARSRGTGAQQRVWPRQTTPNPTE